MGSGCVACSRTLRAHSLIVSGAAALAACSYSASVTFVLIDFVRRVAIESGCNAKIGPRSAAAASAPDSTSSFSVTDVPGEEPTASRLVLSPAPSERSERGTAVPLQHPRGGDVSDLLPLRSSALHVALALESELTHWVTLRESILTRPARRRTTRRVRPPSPFCDGHRYLSDPSSRQELPSAGSRGARDLRTGHRGRSNPGRFVRVRLFGTARASEPW